MQLGGQLGGLACALDCSPSDRRHWRGFIDCSRFRSHLDDRHAQCSSRCARRAWGFARSCRLLMLSRAAA
eukprot:2846163-Prymnesium_polylepis.1